MRRGIKNLKAINWKKKKRKEEKYEKDIEQGGNLLN